MTARGPRRPADGSWGLDRRTRLLFRDALAFVPAYAVPGVASFLTVPALFFFLGVSEYGRWALLYAVAAGVPQVTTSWLEARVVRFGHRTLRSSDRWRRLLAVLGSLLVSAPLALLVLPRATLAEVAAAAWLTVAVTRYLLAIARLQSSMAFGSISIAASVRSVFGAIMGIALGGLTHQAWLAIAGLGTGYFVGEVVGLVSAAWWRRTRAPDPDPAAVTTAGPDVIANHDDAPEERATYGLASSGNAVANYVLSVGDRFLLSTFRSLHDVGVYSATYALVDLVGRFVPSVVLGIIRPRIFRAWDAGRRDELAASLLVLSAGLAWLVAAAVVGIVVASILFPVLPVDPALAAILGFGFATLVPANTIALLYSASTRQARLAAHAATAAAANVLINLLLIPRYGPTGAAVATAVAYGLLVVINAGGMGLLRRIDRPTGWLLASAFSAIAALVVGTATGNGLLGAAAAALALAMAWRSVLGLGRRVAAGQW